MAVFTLFRRVIKLFAVEGFPLDLSSGCLYVTKTSVRITPEQGKSLILSSVSLWGLSQVFDKTTKCKSLLHNIIFSKRDFTRNCLWTQTLDVEKRKIVD